MKKSLTNNLAVMVSGGRSSAMMAHHILTSPIYSHYKKVFIFCNTGLERSETVDFLKNIIKYWNINLYCLECQNSNIHKIGIGHKIVNINDLNMSGVPFRNAILQMNKYKHSGLPNQAIPYCSDYSKTRVAHSFAKEYFGTTKYIKALGYRWEDMPRRITFAELKADKSRIGPLITDFERPINIKDLDNFFNNQPFKLNIPSHLGNCQLCWKKSDKNLIESIRAGTDFLEYTRELENEFKNTMFRNRNSIDHYIKLANSNKEIDLFNNTNSGSCVCTFLAPP